jgi:hypothetical protein
MNRVILLICFLTAFGAGICTGMLSKAPTAAAEDGWLSDLKMTPDQREKIKAIWEEAMKTSAWQVQREKRESLMKERDQLIVKEFITSEQKSRYDEITATYQKKIEEVGIEAKKTKDEAYEKTKALLGEDQRKIYDELRKKRSETKSRGW